MRLSNVLLCVSAVCWFLAGVLLAVKGTYKDLIFFLMLSSVILGLAGAIYKTTHHE